jgi:hypothetical protein
MNEGLRDTKIGLQRCEQCTYFTPTRQPACANCGWRGAGESAGPRPDEAPPVIEPDPRAEAAGPATRPVEPTGRPRTRMMAVILGLSVAVAGASVLAWNTNMGAAPASGAVAVTAAPAPGTAATDDADACARWQALRPALTDGITTRRAIADAALTIEAVAATPATRVPAGRLRAAATGNDAAGTAAAATALDTACR